MYQTSDIRKGLKIEIDGDPWVITEFLFVKPGKGVAFTRTKCKNLITGSVRDVTYKTGETLSPADVEERDMQFLYEMQGEYNFMDMTSFEQFPIPPEVLADAKNFLMEEMTVRVLMFKDRPVGVELPNFVELQITYTEPGVKGNTAQGATKLATLSTGYEVKVPLFIENGEWLKIDTRTGDYVERVSR